MDLVLGKQVWQRVVAGKHSIEGCRPNRNRPHVPDQAVQVKSATPGLLTGALNRSERDVGARDLEAEYRETEGLGTDADCGIEDTARRRTPFVGDER